MLGYFTWQNIVLFVVALAIANCLMVRGVIISVDLRERIPRASHVQRRSFLRTRLCQWLSLRMTVLITATAVSLFKLIAASNQLRMMQVFSDQQSAHHILNFVA